MIYQVRIIYDKETLFASSYCARFFEFCGLLVYEDFECSFLEEAIETIEDEVVINLKSQTFANIIGNEKSFLTKIVEENIEESKLLYPLIDIYVDFSLHKSFLDWSFFEPDENQLFINMLEATYTLEENNDNDNIYMQISIIYLKYMIIKLKEKILTNPKRNKKRLVSAFLKEHPSFTSTFDISISQLSNIIDNLLKTYPELYLLHVLSGNLFSLQGEYYNNAISKYLEALKYVENKFKYKILYNMGLLYKNYSACHKYAEDCYKKILNISQNNIEAFIGLVKLLPKSEDTLAYSINILKLLDLKEQNIPLNPKELLWKFQICHYLLSFVAVDNVDIPDNAFNYITSFEKYYEQLTSIEWIEIFYLKEATYEKYNEILNKLNDVVFRGFFYLAIFYRDIMKDKTKSNYYFEKYSRYLQNMNHY